MDIQAPSNSPGIVRVLEGIRPVLASNKVTVVEFRDKFGDLMALVYRQYNSDVWIFTTKTDDDWESNLIRLGYLNPHITLEELARASGVKK